MSIAHESDLTSDEEPASMPASLEVVADRREPMASMQRLLGATAITEQPHGLYEVVVHEADTLTTEDTKPFAQLIHGILVRGIRKANRRKGRDEEAFLVPPERVDRSLQNYYRVFTDWPVRVTPEQLEELRRAHLKQYADYALRHSYQHPEINNLVDLENELYDKANLAAGNTAHELLAAYGWAIHPERRTKWKELLRQTDNVHYDPS